MDDEKREDEAGESTGTGPESPQSPAPDTPPAPLWSAPANAEPPPPAGPQSPAPGPQSPQSQPFPPPPPPPAGPQAPPPPGQPGYGGPVPPGGWQQPAKPAAVVPGELATWLSRAGAALLDFAIVFVAAIVVIGLIIGGFAASNAIGVVLLIVLGIPLFIALFMYGPYFMGRKGEHNGKTLGKQIVGIRVTRDNGQPYDIGNALIREFLVKGLLFGTVGSFFFYIPFFLDYLWPLWDDQERALHDMIVSSHVVRA